MNIRFAAIQPRYDEKLAAKDRRIIEISGNPASESSDTPHSIVLVDPKITGADQRKQVGWVSQPAQSKVNVDLYETKSGFYAIINSGKLNYIALPGSHLRLFDTEVHLDGDPITAEINGPLVPSNPTPKPQKVTTQAMILGAGLASRFEPISGDYTARSKPGVPINGGDSIILTLANHLKKNGFRKIIVNTFYMPGPIKRELAKIPGVEFIYIDEKKPSGTAGGLVKALNQNKVDTQQPILIVQGDAVTNADMSKLLNSHHDNNPDGVTIGLMTVPHEDVSKLGIAQTMTQDAGGQYQSGKVKYYIEKPKDAGESRGSNLASIGFYVISNKAFEHFRKQGNEMLYPQAKAGTKPSALNMLATRGEFDYAKNFLSPLANPTEEQVKHPEKWPIKVWGEVLDGFWRDVGNPKEYLKTALCLAKGYLHDNGNGTKTRAVMAQYVDSSNADMPVYAPGSSAGSQPVSSRAITNAIYYWPGTKGQAKAQNAQLTGNIVVVNKLDKTV